MKKILVPLLLLALLCMSMAALAEGDEAITLELNTTKLPVYAADDPYPATFGMAAQPEGEALPVLMLPVKKGYELQVKVLPKTLKNKKFTLSVDNEEAVKVRGNSITGLNPGETVLTIASNADPEAKLQYRVFVYQLITKMAVTAPEKNVAVGGTLALTAEYTPENATLKAVTWSSSDEKIATVDENGVVSGLKRGNARITAVALDGSKIRASINVKVNQFAEEITLDKPEITVDTGKTAVLKATVLPKDTDNKKVVWSTSDENIAKVNKDGRVTGVALGECEITCASETNGEVLAKAAVHVQQPVTKIAFGEAPFVYAGETAQLTWTIEPENASNKAVAFKSGNESILTVSEDGTVTGIKAGKTYVSVMTQDGTKRQARVDIKVGQHVTGVHMKRHTAYIDLGRASNTTAILEPDKATNTNMTWVSADESIATAEAVAKQTYRVSIKGISEGQTTVTGTTEDGGYQASILVKVGEFSKALKIQKAEIGGKGQLYIKVVNQSDDLSVTSIKLEVEAYDPSGAPVAINEKDGSNIVQLTYNKRVDPGRATPEDQWKEIDRNKDIGFQRMVVRIVEFQIDNDWVKAIPKGRQPKYEYNPYR